MSYDNVYEIREYTTVYDGREKDIKITAGNLVRVNEDNGFVSFDIAVNRARDKDPVFINRIGVSNDKLKDTFANMKKGQQLFVVWTEVESDKVDRDGNPYVNKYMEAFYFGRTPQGSNN